MKVEKTQRTAAKKSTFSDTSEAPSYLSLLRNTALLQFQRKSNDDLLSWGDTVKVTEGAVRIFACNTLRTDIHICGKKRKHLCEIINL